MPEVGVHLEDEGTRQRQWIEAAPSFYFLFRGVIFSSSPRRSLSEGVHQDASIIRLKISRLSLRRLKLHFISSYFSVAYDFGIYKSERKTLWDYSASLGLFLQARRINL